MMSLQQRLIDTINDTKFNFNNFESLKELQSVVNILITNEMNEIKDSTLDTCLKNHIAQHADSWSDEVFDSDTLYDIPRGLDEMLKNALIEMNIDCEGYYDGEKPTNLSSDFDYIFDECRGYENNTFYIRPFNWDGYDGKDCTCGLDDYYEKEYENLSEKDRASYKKTDGLHSKDCGVWNINFYYKPTGLSISWYKKPLYGAMSNCELDKDVFEAILNDCVKSYRSDFKK